METPLILITNDDGIHAQGIQALAAGLAHVGDVWVVAPETEQSGVSHAITLHRSLRARRTAEKSFSVDGTPTDCVYLALHKLLPRKPALVVSGINHGGNLGEDVFYSGTVGGAMEGTHHGIPSIAVSRVSSHGAAGDFAVAASFAAHLAQRVLDKGLAPGVLLNVNVPKRAKLDTPFAWCALGKHTWRSVVEERHDPRGRPYFWIGGPWDGHEDTPGTDVHAIHRGLVAVTPVGGSLTDTAALAALADGTPLGASPCAVPA